MKPLDHDPQVGEELIYLAPTYGIKHALDGLELRFIVSHVDDDQIMAQVSNIGKMCLAYRTQDGYNPNLYVPGKAN